MEQELIQSQIEEITLKKTPAIEIIPPRGACLVCGEDTKTAYVAYELVLSGGVTIMIFEAAGYTCGGHDDISDEALLAALRMVRNRNPVGENPLKDDLDTRICYIEERLAKRDHPESQRVGFGRYSFVHLSHVGSLGKSIRGSNSFANSH